MNAIRVKNGSIADGRKITVCFPPPSSLFSTRVVRSFRLLWRRHVPPRLDRIAFAVVELMFAREEKLLFHFVCVVPSESQENKTLPRPINWTRIFYSKAKPNVDGDRDISRASRDFLPVRSPSDISSNIRSRSLKPSTNSRTRRRSSTKRTDRRCRP